MVIFNLSDSCSTTKDQFLIFTPVYDIVGFVVTWIKEKKYIDHIYYGGSKI